MLDISVIIPTYKRPAAVLRCLQALAQQTLASDRFEVVVVDDGSGGPTLEQLHAFALQASFALQVVSQPNQGPAAARNRGLAHARGEWAAFTDDDCVPRPDWLEKLWEALPQAADCAGLGGKTFRLAEHAVGRFIDRVGSLQPGRNPSGAYTYVVTCNALLRKAAVVAVGGFDTRVTWAGGEEPILGAALRKAGYFFAAAPEAEVQHQHPASIRALFRMYVRYGRGEKVGSQLQARKGYSGNLLYFIKLFLLENWRTLTDRALSWPERCQFCFFTGVKALGNIWGWWQQSPVPTPQPVASPSSINSHHAS